MQLTASEIVWLLAAQEYELVYELFSLHSAFKDLEMTQQYIAVIHERSRVGGGLELRMRRLPANFEL